MVVMNELEQPMISYYRYVIYLEKFRKIIQQTEKECLERFWIFN